MFTLGSFIHLNNTPEPAQGLTQRVEYKLWSALPTIYQILHWLHIATILRS